MALQYVGGTSAGGQGGTSPYNVSLTSLTGGIGSAPQEGDLVIVVSGWVTQGAVDANVGVSTAGYTEVFDLYSNDTREAQMSVAYKRMGATPDTSVDILGTTSTSFGRAAAIHVWRGVDESYPLDVVPLSATGTNTMYPNAPSIGPGTVGSVILACGMGTSSITGSAAFTTPAGMENGVNVKGDGAASGYAAMASIASYSGWTSGVYDPAAFTGGGTDSTSEAWGAASLVLRPAGVAAVAHRYWRVYLEAITSGVNAYLADVELRTSAGGSDVTGSGTASTNNAVAGSSVAALFDSDITNYWATSTASGVWAKYDFGAGNEQSIVEVALAATMSPNGAPKDFRIEWSDDDVNWAYFGAYTGVGRWSHGQRRTFQPSGEVATPAVAAAARYWRIGVLSVTSGSPRIREIAMRTAVGGADATGTGTAISGLTLAGGLPAEAFDDITGDSTNFWGSASSAPHWWVGYDFGAGNDKSIAEIAITSDTVASAPTKFIVQRSADGLYWHTNEIVAGLAWSEGETKTFTIAAPTADETSHRYWRIRPTDNDTTGSNNIRIADIELRIATGGRDRAGLGWATAVGEYAGESPTNAFDDTSSSYWGGSLATVDQAIKYDFGPGNAWDIAEVAIAADARRPENSPSAFYIEYSDDDSAWTTWGTYSGITGWEPGQRRTFQPSGEVATPAVPTSARFWRVIASALMAGNTFTSFRVGELELRAIAGGADLTGSGTAIGGVNQTGGAPANAFDNSATTEFMSSADDNTWWLGYDFGASAYQIAEMVMTAEDTSATTAPTAFIVQRSNDSHGWDTVDDSFSGLSWTAGESKTFTITEPPPPPSATRPVVFVVT